MEAAEAILLDPKNLGLILGLLLLAVTVWLLPVRPTGLTDSCGGHEGSLGRSRFTTRPGRGLEMAQTVTIVLREESLLVGE